MLSGAEPSHALSRPAIAAVQELPGVGQALQSHLDSILSYTSKDTDLFGIRPGALVQQIGQFRPWRKHCTG